MDDAEISEFDAKRCLRLQQRCHNRYSAFFVDKLSEWSVR